MWTVVNEEPKTVSLILVSMRSLHLFFVFLVLFRQVTGSERSGMKVVELRSEIRSLFEKLPSENPASKLLNSVGENEFISEISQTRVHRTATAANDLDEVLATVRMLKPGVSISAQADASSSNVVEKTNRSNVSVPRESDDIKIAAKNNSETRQSTTSTLAPAATTRHIQGIASELARQMSANFGKGFRSQKFPCDEASHRSLYWAKKTSLPDTRSNRKTHVLETLAYLQGLFDKYAIGPWWICSGTLLGSVRDGGFIPWDTDADISITWSTFDHLRERAPQMEIDARFALDLFPDGCFGEVEQPWVAKYGLGGRLWDTSSGFYVDIFTWKPYGSRLWPQKGSKYHQPEHVSNARSSPSTAPAPSAVLANRSLRARAGHLHSNFRTRKQPTNGVSTGSVAPLQFDHPFPFAGIRNSHISFQGSPGWDSSTYMWFVPREIIFHEGSQRTAECVLDNLTLPCPVNATWWLSHEYGDDFMTPDHRSLGEYSYAHYFDGYFGFWEYDIEYSYRAGAYYSGDATGDEEERDTKKVFS